jgi:hypothetical protein
MRSHCSTGSQGLSSPSSASPFPAAAPGDLVHPARTPAQVSRILNRDARLDPGASLDVSRERFAAAVAGSTRWRPAALSLSRHARTYKPAAVAVIAARHAPARKAHRHTLRLHSRARRDERVALVGAACSASARSSSA